MKILLAFGTRPEAIKMAPLVHQFKADLAFNDVKVCVTGQHREMLDQVLKLFNLTPDYDLNIMKHGQDLYDVTSAVLLGMKDVLDDYKPDLVLVHGDTSTSIAVALSAYYKKIKVGHVEAGLRTNNIYSPWPEELNRQLTSRIANYHFCPTESNRDNLINEGVDSGNIFITGNTVIDALHWVLKQTTSDKELEINVHTSLVVSGIELEKLESWCLDKSRKLVMITGHRRENFGQGFLNICQGIKELALGYPDVDFLYPMHLNPNVRGAIKKVFGATENSNIKISNAIFIEPLDYLPFVYLVDSSYFVLTDSGGIQEEAPGLGKPVLVMRDNTERPEAVKAGTVKLIGTDKSSIYKEVSKLLENEEHYYSMSQATNPYGDGFASKKIVQVIKNIKF